MLVNVCPGLSCKASSCLSWVKLFAMGALINMAKLMTVTSEVLMSKNGKLIFQTKGRN